MYGSIRAVNDHAMMCSLMSLPRQTACVATVFFLWGLTDVGYWKGEACRVYVQAPGVWYRKPESMAIKHVQLGELLQALPTDVRCFVLKQPTILYLNVTSDAFVARVQLWIEEIGQPLRNVPPRLFQVSLKRSAARVGFMQKRKHVMKPSAAELFCSHCNFCLRLHVSDADFEDWHQKWLMSPMGLHYASK